MTAAVKNPTAAFAKCAALARDIKISHTVFAMPWALLATVLAAHRTPSGLTPGKLGLILACMVTARTFAMCINRLLDAKLDAQNPRTARRAIPSGTLTTNFMTAVAISCAALFILACAAFNTTYHNRWPLWLSVPVLAFLAAYPLLKRFTRLCHYYLGAALALAPVCAWVAIGAPPALPPLIMFLAVLSWTAGFDIIYGCQDYQSDIATGVYSVASQVGIDRALWISRATHAFCAAMLIALGVATREFSVLYWIGAALAIALLLIEQSLVSPRDLSKANLAFFTVNGIISVVLGTLSIFDILR